MPMWYSIVFLRWLWAGGVFICRKGGPQLMADNSNCIFKYSSNFGIFSVVGEYGSEVGRVGIFGVATGQLVG